MNPTRKIPMILLVAFAIAVWPAIGSELTSSLKPGSPEIKSAGPLTFGPEGILFMADPISAKIFALNTKDSKKATNDDLIKVPNIKKQIAGLLGTTADQIRIIDLAVNPISRNAYLSIARGRGADAAAVLVKVSSGKVDVVSMENIPFAEANLPNAPDPNARGRRGESPRQQSITDLAYKDGRLFVAGLSNEEFASTLRALQFPFNQVGKGTSVEIYHGAHGRFETRSPVRTFATYDIAGEAHLLAAYTCTPLVKFPITNLKPGSHIKGTTIAELGNRNRPLDMIVYKKGGKDYVLMANSSRGIMKITTDNFAKETPITTRVPSGQKKGSNYDTISEWQGIMQLDQFDADHALVIQQREDGSENLYTLVLP